METVSLHSRRREPDDGRQHEGRLIGNAPVRRPRRGGVCAGCPRVGVVAVQLQNLEELLVGETGGHSLAYVRKRVEAAKGRGRGRRTPGAARAARVAGTVSGTAGEGRFEEAAPCGVRESVAHTAENVELHLGRGGAQLV
eukprot:scaffold3357_cov77-Isochrysis_galbana.AAC.1